MSLPNPQFEGTIGQDPNEYVEAVELFVDEKCNKDNKASWEKWARTVFRGGLNGGALRWYNTIPFGDRKEYESIKRAFVDQYSGSEMQQQQDRDKWARMAYGFERRGGERLSEFVRRGTEIESHIVEDTLKNWLRDQLLKGLRMEESERDIYHRVTDGLFYKDKMEVSGVLKRECNFADVRSHIIRCAMVPGNEEEYFPTVH
jgi:hypothetical protein